MLLSTLLTGWTAELGSTLQAASRSAASSRALCLSSQALFAELLAAVVVAIMHCCNFASNPSTLVSIACTLSAITVPKEGAVPPLIY